MRKVKCKICGSVGTNETFFKVIYNNKNEYYCSEGEYIENKKEKNKNKELLTFICQEILNYNNNQITPPILIKKIKELNKYYPLDVIKNTFEKKLKILKYWMNLEDKFDTDFSKISYMMSIIKNNINDIYKEYKINKEKEITENQGKRMDVELYNDDFTVDSKKVKNDISSFLE